MEIANSMPPTSGIVHARLELIHLSRHYFDHHSVRDDVVQVVDVPGEESEDSPEMTTE